MTTEASKKTNDVYDLRKCDCRDSVDLIQKLVSNKDFDTNNAFYIADLDEIYRRLEQWRAHFPRVEPLYAVKNNNDCKVLRLLAYLGIAFECSSLHEIEELIKLNIAGEKLLFGNPAKSSSHIKYCEVIGVNKLVFDNEQELLKIRENHPQAELLIRIKCKSLPSKFGANLEASLTLIEKAIRWNMNLIGVSFYVGFRQQNATNIVEAIRDSRLLFDYARLKFGYLMSCLDIGGGFPGTWQSTQTFRAMAEHINQELDTYFPESLFQELNKNAKKFYIISELGTYFTCSAYTLCVTIIAKKEIDDTLPVLSSQPSNNGQNRLVLSGERDALITDPPPTDFLIQHSDDTRSIIYYINDSVYGSFKWYSMQESPPIFFTAKTEPRVYVRACIGGGTCDSGDFIIKNCLMPELEIGDFFIFRNMGSYTKACAIDFCGIKLPETIYVSGQLWDEIKSAFAVQKKNQFQSFKEYNQKMSAKNILADMMLAGGEENRE